MAGHGGGESGTSTSTKVCIFLAALVFGTGCSLTSKILLELKAIGASGEEETFTNPVFQVWGMFLAMSMALPVHWIYSCMFKRNKRNEKAGYSTFSTQDSAADDPPPVTSKMLVMLAIPAIFDMIASTLDVLGLTYTPVSIYQMLRGSTIVFVAIFKRTLLRHALSQYQWIGVVIIALSIALVGMSASSGDGGADAEGAKSNPLLGIAFILSGSNVQALQYCFEEKVMGDDVGVPPLLVIGMEGFWGLMATTFVVFPGLMISGVCNVPYDMYVLLSNSHRRSAQCLQLTACSFLGTTCWRVSSHFFWTRSGIPSSIISDRRLSGPRASYFSTGSRLARSVKPGRTRAATSSSLRWRFCSTVPRFTTSRPIFRASNAWAAHLTLHA
jgi:drug/metabolite transporter (DMT)-like permease